MTIEVKLIVDKKKNQVVLAECDSDFVDVLFSFMTLPLGTIVRLLNKKSGLGCMDKLYESIEKLNTQYLPCKTMLLQPRNTAEKLCEDLVLNINDLEPRKIFVCPNWDCMEKTPCYFSSISGVTCSCGKLMDRNIEWKKVLKGDGVFVKRGVKFMMSDDLSVVVSSVGAAASFLQNYDAKDVATFEEMIVQVGKAKIISNFLLFIVGKVLQVLKRSFVSRTTLTDVFLRESTNVDTVKTEIVHATTIKVEDDKSSIKRKHQSNKPNAMKVKILEHKSNSKAFIMESGNDFVDLLFSFLTFPLGCVMSLLSKSSSAFTLGCINNVYKSIDDLSKGNEGTLLAESKDMLLNPKLHPHFGCENQILKVDVMQSTQGTFFTCKNCFTAKPLAFCLHGLPAVKDIEINPKLQNASSENGGGFAKTSTSFMITTEMTVQPVSAFTAVQHLKNLGNVNGLQETIVSVGETEALNLLKACLSSPKAINKSFFK